MHTMIKILNPHTTTTTTLKTAEILSKYRPIAPKPGTTSQANDNDPSSTMSHKINQSPYLRSLWPQLQARPTRTRKRGRGGMGTHASPLAMKRPKSCTSNNNSTQHTLFGCPIKTLSFQAYATHHHRQHHHGLPNLAQVGYALENNNGSSSSSDLVTLPLLQCSPLPSSKCMETETKGKGVTDLNKRHEVIQERDFLKQLQGPIVSTTPKPTSRVISPLAIRPVCSRINVACINPSPNPSGFTSKSPQEVEEAVESDDLPSIISDSNNRVRLVNSAYKEMMGQPECSWLDSMVRGKRICGEVMIRFSESEIPENNGFSCWVRIEWGRDGKEEFVHAFCDVAKLACDSKDYVYTWRFHTERLVAQASTLT